MRHRFGRDSAGTGRALGKFKAQVFNTFVTRLATRPGKASWTHAVEIVQPQDFDIYNY